MHKFRVDLQEFVINLHLTDPTLNMHIAHTIPYKIPTSERHGEIRNLRTCINKYYCEQ